MLFTHQSFAFDNVFHDDCPQVDVFEQSAAETVEYEPFFRFSAHHNRILLIRLPS